MDINGRYARQILLFSLVVLIIPMILFPHRLGTGLARASLINVVFELAFYAIVVFALTRRASLVPLAQAAGLCLIYRLGLGAAFGLLISVMYSMNLRVSFSLGLSSYLPAVLLHVATAPFILLPLVKQLTGQPDAPGRPSEQPEEAESTMPERQTTFVTSRERTAPTRPIAEVPSARVRDTHHTGPPASGKPGDVNGFDRATAYIGEDAGVQVAAVVDNEGLLLGHFQRGGGLAEDWAPLALLFFEQNQKVTRRFSSRQSERLVLTLEDRKIVIAREDWFYLMVVADRHNEEMLNIRFSQGLEIVKRHVAERYGAERAVKTENAYVRSTQ